MAEPAGPTDNPQTREIFAAEAQRIARSSPGDRDVDKMPASGVASLSAGLIGSV
jgi:hypothetical protein